MSSKLNTKSLLQMASLLLTFGVSSMPAHAQSSTCNWTGTWTTQYGELRIVHAGNKFVGDYGATGTITGVVNDECKVSGNYRNSNGYSGAFEFAKQGSSLIGQYGGVDKPLTSPWNGTRQSDERPVLTTAPYPLNEVVRQNLTTNSGSVSQPITLAQPAFNNPTALIEAPTKPPTQTRDEQLRELRKKAAERTTAKREAYLKEQEREQAAARSARIRASIAERRREQARDLNRETRLKNEINALEQGTWKVTLEGMCALGTSEGDVLLGVESEDVFGIAWIRTRIIDKSQSAERQIDLPPVGGFTRVNGDKERVWEIRPSERAINLTKIGDFNGLCGKISHSGDQYSRGAEFQYTVDFDNYGYKDVHEFLNEPRNRIDVMFKLSEKDVFRNDNLGTRRVATSFKDSNFCVQCDQGMLRNVNKPRFGNGVISGFTDGETNIHVYYGIQPEGTALEQLYEQPDLYSR